MSGDDVKLIIIPLEPVMDALKKYHPLLCTGDIKDDVISKNIDKFQNEDINKVENLINGENVGTLFKNNPAS